MQNVFRLVMVILYDMSVNGEYRGIGTEIGLFQKPTFILILLLTNKCNFYFSI